MQHSTNISHQLTAPSVEVIADKQAIMRSIAEFYAGNKGSVRSLLERHGYETSSKPTNAELIAMLNIALENPNFAHDFAKALVETDHSGFASIYSNAGGGKFWDKIFGGGGGATTTTSSGSGSGSGGSGGGAGSMGGPVTAIANAIGSIFGTISVAQERKLAREESETELLNNIMVAEANKNQITPPDNTGLLLMGGIVVSVILVIGVIAYKKSSV